MIDLAALPRLRLADLAAAGEAMAEAEAEMRHLGAGPVELLTQANSPEPFRHYPDGDLYDPVSRSQFYFHVHRAADHGHVHLFLRPNILPCHLVAVGFGADGWPCELFTTNRWVTGEEWRSAEAVKLFLPRFRVAIEGEAGLVGRWLTALVAFHAPLIDTLIDARDEAVAAWSLLHPEGDPLEDEGLEITSRLGLDEPLWRQSVRRALGGA